MSELDRAAKWTDDELEALERRIGREYSKAAADMRSKHRKWLRDFDRERRRREKELDGSKEAGEAYKRWLEGQARRGNWLGDMTEQLAKSASQANRIATDMVNDSLPHVYAENANRAAFSVDKAVRADTGFTLVNEDAVRRIIETSETMGQLVPEVVGGEPKLGPADVQTIRKREMDYPKDMRWNRQKFTSAITQGILQGESIPNIVKRTESVFGMNRNASIRAARTATTNAENAGRMNSFERARRLGIDMEIVWQATLDGRTRSSHRRLDGERIQLGEHFESEYGPIRWPGDPQAHPAETWNCRCRADGRVVGFDGKRGDWADEVGERWSRLPEGMTYEQWKAGKVVSRAESYGNEAARVSGAWYAQRAVETATAAAEGGFAGIAEGQDILGTWQRRPDEFDFEIEDVMNAQGFDGKPRIVDADEFDRAVKEANGGDGLVMQRSYSAPDQATLDAYREMLYDGKWYVDCSTGGSQYGQGMYAAADYTGKVTADMQKEMRHYTTLNQGRLGAQPLSDEGKEAFLRKWVGENVAEADRDAAFTYLKFESHTGNVEWADVGKAVEQLGEEKRLSLLESGVHEDVHQMLDGYSYVETMTLDPSAKVIAYKDLKAEYSHATIDLQRARDRVVSRADYRYYDLGEITKEEYDRLIASQPTLPTDMGSYAASRGYDAINATGHGASGSYTVVLNRTKLIIRRPE